MATSTKQLTTAELLAMLRGRSKGDAVALFTNVADGTGSNVSRWADALTIGLWPSRGMLIEGFELKVSRTDWLKELKHPEKAEAVCKYCDRWWVVAGGKDIVREGELPPTWGLLVATGSGLRCITQAPRLTPVPLDRSIVAAIARRAVEQSAEAEQLDAARKEGIEEGKAMRKWELKQATELKERVAAFTAATGIDLDPEGYVSKFRYKDAKDIGAAVLATMGQTEGVVDQLRKMRWAAKTVLNELDGVLPKEPD
jgi:hypothetical protein